MKKFLLLFLVIINCIKLCYAGDVTPISDFNSVKYLGVWYEVARLPNRFEDKCLTPITATYSINPDNSNQLIVVNQCNTKNNETPDIATGAAYFVESTNIGKLEVTFLPKWLRWLSFGYGDYWILNVDYDSFALIGSPDHKYLWVLARSKDLSRDILEKTLVIAKEQGFDITKLIYNYPSEHQIK